MEIILIMATLMLPALLFLVNRRVAGPLKMITLVLHLKNLWQAGRASPALRRLAEIKTILIKNAVRAWKKLFSHYSQALLKLNRKRTLQGNDYRNLSFVELVEKARREWEESKILFNETSDPDLMDHAIYAMEAAEKKYVYLLKMARKEKITDKNIYPREDNGLA